MADYTKWWQYIIILTVIGFLVFIMLETYFVYVPLTRIENQVYHTTDLLESAGAAATRIEEKIDATLTILAPLIIPVARILCELVCGMPTVISPSCPSATFEFCESIQPPDTTGPSTLDLVRGLSTLQTAISNQ